MIHATHAILRILIALTVSLVVGERTEQPRPGRSVLLLQKSAAWSGATLTWTTQHDGNLRTNRTHEGCTGKPCHASSEAMHRINHESLRVKRPAMVQSHQQVNSSQPIGEPLNDVDEVSSDFTDEEDEKKWSSLLPLELHLVGVTIAKLLDKYAEEPHLSDLGGYSNIRSLAALLLLFKKEISKACKVDETKILMNAIFGRFLRESASSILKSTSGIYPIDAGRASLMSTVVPFNERLGEEVVVRFFVHPRREGDDFASLVSTLQDALGDSNSSLMKGDLSAVLKHASLTTGYQDVSGFTTIPMEKLSNLALPFAISALFTGILIWLAG
eukprot:symbB.v1.2.023392.t1/scaffold2138.1/size88104/4